MKRRQVKKNAKKLAALPFGGRKDLRVTYLNVDVTKLRGMSHQAGVLDDAGFGNVRKGPYDGPLYNPPVEEMPVPGKHYDVKCLRAMAKAKGIKGSVSTMKKQDLINAILANQGETK